MQSRDCEIYIYISITVAVNANSKRFFTQFWRIACEFRSRMAFRVTKTLKILSRHLYPLYSWPAFVPAFPLYFVPFFFSFLLLFFFLLFFFPLFFQVEALLSCRGKYKLSHFDRRPPQLNYGENREQRDFYFVCRRFDS